MNPPTAKKPLGKSFAAAGIAALMVAFSVMSYFDRTIMSIAGPAIIREFGLSETEMGTVYSAFILSYALLMIPGGRWADRLGPRLVLTVMGLGAALFTGLTALGGRPGLGTHVGVVPALVLIRLGLGVATAPIYPSCGRMNANWFPETRRGRVWGFVAAGAGLGGAASPPLFSRMIARYGWRNSFWLAAAGTALLALAWYGYTRDYPEEHPSITKPSERSSQVAVKRVFNRHDRTPWRKLLTDRNLMLLTIGYFAVCYFEYLFFYWIFYYFGEVRHVEPARTATYTALLFLTWTVMTPLGGWVSDRFVERCGRKAGRRLVPIIGLVLSAVLLGCGATVSRPAAAAGVLSLALGFASASDGPFWAAAIDMGGAHVGAAGAVLNTGGNLGGFFAPIVTPFIASHFGWSSGLYSASLIMMLSVLVWFFVDPTKVIRSE